MPTRPNPIAGPMIRRRTGAAALAALALALMLPAAASAAYPERTISLIVPFPAGGPTDIIARIVSNALQRSLGQSVIVENRGGGGGNVGIGIVARATPDGYTLLLTSTAIAVNPALYSSLPYDPIKDFLPICELVNAPNVIFVRPESGIKSLADLIARAKAAPGVLNYASPGVGTKSHLAAEQLKLRAGIDIVHIPYRGGGPATMGVLDGTVHVGSVALAPVEPLIKDGKFIALAVTGAKRWFSLPDVPTMIEVGLSGLRLGHLQRAVCARRNAAPRSWRCCRGRPRRRSRRRRRAPRRTAPATRSSPGRRPSWQTGSPPRSPPPRSWSADWGSSRSEGIAERVAWSREKGKNKYIQLLRA